MFLCKLYIYLQKFFEKKYKIIKGRVVKLVYTRDLDNLSAFEEIQKVEFRKFGESFTANTEPSPEYREGVETRHGTPKLKIW